MKQNHAVFVKHLAGYLLAARTALASQGGPDIHTLACKADGPAPSPLETCDGRLTPDHGEPGLLLTPSCNLSPPVPGGLCPQAAGEQGAGGDPGLGG